MPAANKPRPVHLDLTKIRLPLPGILSILHRVSGLGLFLFLPLLLGLLQMSLGSQEQYGNFSALVGHPLVKLILLGLTWAFLHHLFAGIRYLVMDVNHQAATLQRGRQSAVIVFVVSLVLTVVLGYKLW
jgi:succinate dehydrogenase / fumarate reductase cytochrome b subunit